MATRSHSRTSGADRGRRDRDTASARGRRGTGPRRSPATVWAGLRARLVPSGEVTQEFLLLAATGAVLLVLGLLMTFSASFVQSTADTGDPFGIFTRQLLWCGVGLVPLLVATFADYHTWRPLAGLLLTVTVVALAVVLIPGIGVEVGGARRWIDFGALRFQPTELAKLSLPLYLSSLLARRWAQLRAGDLHALLMPALPLLCLMAVLVMGEPDLETAALIVAIGGIVLFAAGLPARLIAWAVGALGLFGVAAIAFTPFRRARLAAWFDPMAYADTYGYQTVQGFIALGSGGLLGVGLGQSRGKWLYVPNAHTDFIYAIIGEELGLAGAMFVLLLFALLAVGGFRTARLAPDPFGRLLAASITGWLLLQAAINIGSVVGLLPVTGVTLPLVSFGGSSLVFTMAGYGLLLSISRQANPARSGTRAGDHPGHRARQRRDQRFRARTSSTRATGAGG